MRPGDNYPDKIEMTSEEVEQMNKTPLGEMFHFRGKKYWYMGKHSAKNQWLLFTENETFIVTEDK